MISANMRTKYSMSLNALTPFVNLYRIQYKLINLYHIRYKLTLHPPYQYTNMVFTYK